MYIPKAGHVDVACWLCEISLSLNMLCDILTFVICDEIDQFKVSCQMTYNVFSGTLNPTHFTCQRFSYLKVTMLDLGTVIVCTVVAHGNAEEKKWPNACRQNATS